MSTIVAIALSGGVDSLVAAARLQEMGYRPMAFHFLTGYETLDHHTQGTHETPSPIERIKKKLSPLTDRLRMELHIVDLRQEFQSQVVDYFVATYGVGKTPNPCLVCNPKIKFDLLFQKARSLGADMIATGHYARIFTDDGGKRRLLRGRDPLKDQSYFLARLTQEQLSHALLPLGEMTKSQTRHYAAQHNLIPATTKESQDVCFITAGDYHSFLVKQPGFVARSGPIVDISGRRIGTHNGLHAFTVGQRRGINCPAKSPFYVLRLDPYENCLVVGGKENLGTSACQVEDINWIVDPPNTAFRSRVKVRYRHASVPATITPLSERSAEVVFDLPEAAVTPGQGAVFFNDDEVLGGGWIQ
jgi:tRNA-specific 2-thiouridylase